MNQEMIGESAVMQALRRRILEAARSHMPCLITGETGSGKELVAWEIYKASGREPYIRQSCAGIPDGLIYAEYFGHRKGSFTGTTGGRNGKFAEADGGTLFLDEIGDFPLEHQPVLLRAMDPGEVTPLGENKSIKVDVRVIAATNRDLSELVSLGRFRKDLLFRLEGCVIEVPPLRERAEDIPLLIRHYATRAGEIREIDPEALELLVKYSWPGNVRELKYEIEGAVLRAENGPIMQEHLNLKILDYCGETVNSDELKEFRSCEYHVERMLCEKTIKVLVEESGSRSRAAERLDIDRSTLYRRLKRWHKLGWVVAENCNGRSKRRRKR